MENIYKVFCRHMAKLVLRKPLLGQVEREIERERARERERERERERSTGPR